MSGHPDLALGNVIGSNISNIALVLAITILITPYFVKTATVIRDWIVMFLISVLLVIFLNSGEVLSRTEGITMVLLLIIFVTWVIGHSRKELRKTKIPFPEAKYSILLSVIVVIISSLGLVFGAHLLVKGASSIAVSLGVSERVISVSVIAFGTSLPELATSVIAAARKQNEISIGNIIGSNIFNILAILGITATVTPVKVESKEVLSFDVWYMLGISALLMLLILPIKGAMLSRWKGLILISAYIAFIYFVYL